MKIEKLGFIVHCNDGSLTVRKDTDDEGIILINIDNDYWIEVEDVKDFCKALTDFAKEIT